MDPFITLDAIQRRDPQAVAALVREHHRMLRGYVAALSADPEAVDDQAQEVFLRALQKLDRVEDLNDFGKFLRGIARNVAHEHARAKARHTERYMDFAEAAAPAEAPHDLQALRRCMDRLPPKSRRLLELRYAEERGAEEIGREVGMPPGTVRVVLLRIREALLKCLRSNPTPTEVST